MYIETDKSKYKAKFMNSYSFLHASMPNQFSYSLYLKVYNFLVAPFEPLQFCSILACLQLNGLVKDYFGTSMTEKQNWMRHFFFLYKLATVLHYFAMTSVFFSSSGIN